MPPNQMWVRNDRGELCRAMLRTKRRMTKLTLSPPQARRQWLIAALRWFALSALTLVAALLGLRRRADTTSSDCLRELPCGQCGQNLYCGLPRATGWRNAQGRAT